MREGIHPNYGESVVTCSSCNSEVTTRATVPVIRVDLCSNCHPFYTGKQRIVDTAGRVERFNQRRAASEKVQRSAKTAARKREKASTTATASAASRSIAADAQ